MDKRRPSGAAGRKKKFKRDFENRKLGIFMENFVSKENKGVFDSSCLMSSSSLSHHDSPSENNEIAQSVKSDIESRIIINLEKTTDNNEENAMRFPGCEQLPSHLSNDKEKELFLPCATDILVDNEHVLSPVFPTLTSVDNENVVLSPECPTLTSVDNENVVLSPACPTLTSVDNENVLSPACPTVVSTASENAVLLPKCPTSISVDNEDAILYPACHTDSSIDNENVVLFPSWEKWPTDPSLFPLEAIVRNKHLRQEIVDYGPCRPNQKSFDFPTVNSRRFSTVYYDRLLQTGQPVPRTWLCYSPKKDAAFCFACWLFANRNDPSYENNFSEVGVNDWKHLGQKVKKHESSSLHLDAMGIWKLWQSKRTLEFEIQSQQQQKISELRLLLHRLLDVILHLTKQNMSFRGNNEQINGACGGNFLATVKLLSKYDHVLQSHLDNPRKCTYLSHHIQNELIELSANKVREQIKLCINDAKYFAIIADTTTDIAHVDQLSLVIRYVRAKECGTSEVVESFTGFIPVMDPSASGLEQTILHHLESTMNLDLSNCRGQGYDGAAVMSGIYNGVSQKILRRQPLAVYVHCASHCLNLVLCDAAATSVDVSTFFGVLQKLYTFLSSSNTRWQHFTASTTKLITVKKLCVTRWEARIDAVQAVLSSFLHILKCLEEIRDNPHHKCRGEELVDIASLLNFLRNFKFILLLFIWEKVLVTVRVASKFFQKQDCEISIAANMLTAATDDMKDFRKNGFEQCFREATDFAKNHGISPVFSSQRKRTKKRHHDETSENEMPTDPLKKFECVVFNTMVDVIITQMEHRLMGIKSVSNTFSFLEAKQLNSMAIQDIKVACLRLCEAYSSDINEIDFFAELMSLRRIIPGELKSKDIKCATLLSYLTQHNLHEAYPNVVTAYKLLLTIPISVASCERTFSKLKLIKNYLRTSMSQERLSSLALLSVENEFAAQLNYDDIITSFANMKVRKGKF